ncbi:MAG: hypothetical protein KAT76_04610 [Bacteroidales bacterium]|nr:hypothetical protein [Bacteroidales bacterium]
MKNLFYVFLMLSFFLFSCGGSSEQAAGDSDEAVKTEQSEDVSDEGDLTVNDCDDFLDKYDQWTDDYLKVLKAYFEDPTNLTISEEYLELTESMTTWYTDWTNYAQCASQEKYQERFEEIADKLEKGMEEIGIGE